MGGHKGLPSHRARGDANWPVAPDQSRPGARSSELSLELSSELSRGNAELALERPVERRFPSRSRPRTPPVSPTPGWFAASWRQAAIASAQDRSVAARRETGRTSRQGPSAKPRSRRQVPPRSSDDRVSGAEAPVHRRRPDPAHLQASRSAPPAAPPYSGGWFR